MKPAEFIKQTARKRTIPKLHIGLNLRTAGNTDLTNWFYAVTELFGAKMEWSLKINAACVKVWENNQKAVSLTTIKRLVKVKLVFTWKEKTLLLNEYLSYLESKDLSEYVSWR